MQKHLLLKKTQMPSTKGYPKEAVRAALDERFRGPDSPRYLRRIKFHRGDAYVALPDNLSDDDFENEMASYEGIVLTEMSDLFEDGGIEDYIKS